MQENNIIYYIYKIGKAEHFVRMIEWQKLFKFLNPKKEEQILDIACGNGMLSLKIAQKCYKVYGIDLSQNAIDQAKYISRRDNIENCDFKVGNAENLPYPDKFFDKVVCSSALEHFEDDNMALKEMDRVLKNKGVLALSVDSFTYPIDQKLKDIHKKRYYVNNYYNYDDLLKKFKITNLKIDKHDFCFNSFISTYLFNNIFIKTTNESDTRVKTRIIILLFLFSLFLFPICWISDKFFGKKNMGNTLLIRCTKNDLN